MALRVGNRRELLRRGQYALAAAQRVARAVVGGKPLNEALSAERANLEAHKAARKQRQSVDLAIEASAEVYGDVLGWYLGPNENHCPLCLRAAGNNFRASNPPAIGLPGAPHGGTCYCSSGAPFPDGRLLS